MLREWSSNLNKTNEFNINYHLLTMKLDFYFRNYFDALEGVVSRFY